jgi:uncharacterized protein
MCPEPKNPVKIAYPCEWEYRVISIDEAALRLAISQIMGERKYNVEFSKTSKSGKYVSLAITTFVETEEIRNQLFVAFSKHVAVKHVL